MFSCNSLKQSSSCCTQETLREAALILVKVVAAIACVFFACMAYHSSFDKAWEAVFVFSVLSVSILTALACLSCASQEKREDELVMPLRVNNLAAQNLPKPVVSTPSPLILENTYWQDCKGDLRSFTTPLSIAIKRKDGPAISSLIAAGHFEPFDRANAMSCLVAAAIKAENPLTFLAYIQQLQGQGFDVESRDCNGDTAHHVLVRHTHFFGFAHASAFEKVVCTKVVNSAGFTPEELKTFLSSPREPLPPLAPCRTAREELLRARSTLPQGQHIFYAGKPWLVCDFLLYWLDHKEISLQKVPFLFSFVKFHRLTLTEKELVSK